MTTLADSVKKCNDSLAQLRTLMNAALAAKDVSDATSLQSRIQDMTYKAGLLAGDTIKADDATIARLNGQLDTVTKAATTAIADLAKIAGVLNDVDIAMKTINSIVGMA